MKRNLRSNINLYWQRSLNWSDYNCANLKTIPCSVNPQGQGHGIIATNFAKIQGRCII